MKAIRFIAARLGFHFGRDEFNYDMWCLIICWKSNPNSYHLANWLLSVSVGLPYLRRIGSGPYEPDVHYSSRWTGREFTIKEFKWPFEFKLYR